MMFIHNVICAEKNSNNVSVRNYFLIFESNFLNIQIIAAVMLTFIYISFIVTLYQSIFQYIITDRKTFHFLNDLND